MRLTCRTWGRPEPCRVRSTSRHAPLRQKRRETLVREFPGASPTRRHAPGRPGGRAQNRAAKPPEPQVSRTRRRVTRPARTLRGTPRASRVRHDGVTVVARTAVAPSSAEKLRRRVQVQRAAWGRTARPSVSSVGRARTRFPSRTVTAAPLAPETVSRTHPRSAEPARRVSGPAALAAGAARRRRRRTIGARRSTDAAA